MTSPVRHLCISCSAELSAGASLGLCPACAFRAALLMDDSSEPAREGVLRRMGDYDLLEETGRGGMGVVYRARQRSLERTVALKVLLGGYFAGEEGRQRFRREAAAAARLSHAGIVAIHEAGEVDGQPFYSMDFIEGQTLAAMLRRGPLPFRQAAALMEKIAAALHCAHTQGVLHRDLKPSNVLVDESGEPHVTDFGLAKILDESRSRDDGATLTHQIVGSPAWMAPEQATARGPSLTPAADVYAAGAVLYEMLTGRPPFHGETPQAVLVQVQNADPVSPRRLNASIPADLETVCLKCLEKEPRRRYATAAGLAEDLKRFLADEPVMASPPGAAGRVWRWARRHRIQAAALSAVILAFAIVAAVLAVTGVRVSRARQRAEAQAAESRRLLLRSHIIAGTRYMDADDTQRALPFLLEAQKIEGELIPGTPNSVRLATAVMHSPQPLKMWRAGGQVKSLRFNHDGKRIACANSTPLVRLWSTDPADATEIVLSHQSPVFFANFNADGSRILTADESAAYLWDAAKHARIGPPFPHSGSLASVDQKRPPLFDAGGTFFITCDGRSLRRWSAGDGTAGGAEINIGGSVTAHCFLPDAAKVLAANDKNEVILCDAVTGTRLSTVRLPDIARSLSVNASGQRAAAICGRNRVVIFEPASPDIPLAEGLHDASGFAYQADFLPGGRHVLSSSFDGTVRLWDSVDARLLKSLPHPGGVIRAEHSPNGRRIVSVCWDGGVRIVALPDFRSVCAPMMHTGPASAADITATGDVVVSAGSDEMVRLWRASPHALISARGALQPDSWQPGLAAARYKDDGTFTIIDPSTGRPLSQPVSHGAAIEQVCLSYGAGRLAALDKEGATLWDIARAVPVRRIAVPHRRSIQMLMTADGFRVVIVSGAWIRIFPASGSKDQELQIKVSPPVHTIALSPDGHWIAAADARRQAMIWSLEDGRPGSGPLGGEEGVHSVTWSPDSQRLAIASGPPDTLGTAGRTLTVYAPATGNQLTPPLIHNDDICAVAFSPDGRWIATGCEDMLARIIDAGTGALCGATMPHGGFVNDVAFNASGTLLATSSLQPRMHLWEVPSGQSAGHQITTASSALRLFFNQSSITLTGWYGPPNNSVFRTASLFVQTPPQMSLSEFLTAISGFHMNTAGNIESVPGENLKDLWHRLHPPAGMTNRER